MLLNTQPMPGLNVIAVVGLLCGVGALGCCFVLWSRLGKVRYRLAVLDRQSTTRAQELLGLNREISQLQAKLESFRSKLAAATRPFAIATVPGPRTHPIPVAAIPPPQMADPLEGLPAAEPFPQPSPPPPASLSIESLIERINRGDRSTLRDAEHAQLNITKASEDAIQMGRIDATRLEVVSGGGSYLHFHLKGVDWLLPTERTLEAFRNQQQPKGLFRFHPTPGHQPLVIQAARLQADGDQWKVEEIGEIEFPG